MKLNFEIKTGAVLGLFIVIMSLISFFWTPYDYNEMNHENRFAKPSARHILGTDNFGRDNFSRVMAGGRNSLMLAVCAVTAAAAAGCLLGLLAGYLGGACEFIIMRVIDAVNSLPGILVALLFVSVMENSRFTLFIALFVLFTPSYTRIIRTGAMRYKNASFTHAEIILGAGFFRIMFIHILPNLFPSLLSASVLGLSNAILAEASMSYLGLGIQPPLPSWGRMLYESQAYFLTSPFSSLAPGFFIMLTVTAFHLLGEGVRRNISDTGKWNVV